jgi:hypothetical protein
LAFKDDNFKTTVIYHFTPVTMALIKRLRLPGMVAHACHPSYLGGRGRRIKSLRMAWSKLVRPYFKKKGKDSKWVVAQVGCRTHALGSKPTTEFKKAKIASAGKYIHRREALFTVARKAISENSVYVPQKIKNRTVIRFNNLIHR